ncbi:uroporphyrinogen-III synthase [Thalassospira sp. MCCC 1A01428]|uniref:uroporphyrinogen-III synthase n=1 Tax=Thalassospira sp. MCCC 1A01428 TaxID=1470575 RepID=UPI000A1E15C3|nr:uroporphyrinogen-III synthase [Thalassospira sp. MCCC 1A01428]OSQ43943.1 uroporphyrinogen III synthase [Thalassospira sp. MCCC 1A01428]
MGKTVLNTRPETDSTELRAELAVRGYQVCSAPMLTIEFPPLTNGNNTLDLEDVHALVFTSANGVRAFTCHCNRRDWPVLTVGDATASTARSAGFVNIASAGGDIHDLARLISQRLSPDAGILYHPAARKTAGGLGTLLASKGYLVRRETLYEAHATNSFPPAIMDGLVHANIDAVLFFSPRTAETFVKLVEHHNIKGAMANMTAICLSPAVKDRLACLDWRKIKVAEQPTQQSLLSALDNAIA